jgi:hypothetical protein
LLSRPASNSFPASARCRSPIGCRVVRAASRQDNGTRKTGIQGDTGTLLLLAALWAVAAITHYALPEFPTGSEAILTCFQAAFVASLGLLGFEGARHG